MVFSPISRRAFSAVLPLAAQRKPRGAPQSAPPLVSFGAPWTSPFQADPRYPHQLVNRDGAHLFVLNKTAWAYFGCQDPRGFLGRAAEQGVTVIRVALEGAPYFTDLGIDMWPWGGARREPDWTRFSEEYWNRVEERTRMAGEAGIGLDVVLYFTLKLDAAAIPSQRAYWDQTLRRLAKYANVLTWEVHNEHIGNEALQDAAGTYLRQNDPWKRPVCTSDGTTDDAVWPQKAWMDLAVVHTCTGSTAAHDLRDWYQSVARNVRSHGKPAFNNESGREKRHRNDDPAHRRKQGWIWCACGAFWTWHSWEGCEGIDDAAYRGPGAEYLRPMSDFFRSIPFWKLNPNYTALAVDNATLVQSALADADRTLTIGYLCTRGTGEEAAGPVAARSRLPAGEYRWTALNPADLAVVRSAEFSSRGLGQAVSIALPGFQDDLLVKIELLKGAARTPVEGTR